MFCGVFKLSKEYVWVPEVAVGTTLGRLVSEVARYLQPLRVVSDGAREVSEQVAGVAQVAARPAHGLPVAKAAHQLQILSVNSLINLHVNNSYQCSKINMHVDFT